MRARDEVDGHCGAGGAADSEPDRVFARRDDSQRRRRHRARAVLRVAEEAPRPLPRSDTGGREIEQLGGERVLVRGHEVVESGARRAAERRPVEIVVGHEAGVIIAAAAREDDAIHRRVLRPRKLLEQAERGQRHALRAPVWTRERVPARQRVVHHFLVLVRRSDAAPAERLVLDQRVDVVATQALAAVQERARSSPPRCLLSRGRRPGR